jgi:hypothetical protein
MSDEYWSCVIDAICDQTGVQFDAEQTTTVISILAHAHQDYGDQHGHHEADLALRRSNENAAREPVVQFIEQQMVKLDQGPNFFHILSNYQKEGLAYLTMVRKEFRKRGMIA